ncbi:nicotinamide riboside transporter PnuC [Paenibacillus koleovorans]|uniref:nicotinamide riboside transporter PnuC n=1 Tax=Paenibacillus koleovorans TaxID=121608 RepID=UPI000FDA4BC9|nr:nicotinamide riboside transporter PnuC [Paenibacillus koleovorans]
MLRKWGMAAVFVVLFAIAYWTSTTTLELWATTTGLLCVWLTARQNIWAWPISLINVGCFFFLFEEAKLYADMSLQVVFFVLSIYGWIHWLTQREGAKVRPTRSITPGLAVVLGVLLVVVTLGWGHVLARFTDASIPYIDAFIATLSLIAQYLLSSKVLQNWLVWISVDVLSIGMYAYKELNTVAMLYVVYLLIATSGYISWRREMAGAGRKGEVVWRLWRRKHEEA